MIDICRQPINIHIPTRRIINRKRGPTALSKNDDSKVVIDPAIFSESQGNMVPKKMTKVAATKSIFVRTKEFSLEIRLASLFSLLNDLRRITTRPNGPISVMVRKARKRGSIPVLVKVCTEERKPLRVRNVPNMHRLKVKMMSTIVQTLSVPVLFCMLIE